VLTERIGAIHAASHGTYGSPRVHIDLTESGTAVGRKRVARLMKAAGLRGVSRRRFVTTTMRDGARRAADLVDRKFVAAAPNVLWVADITYIATWSGFLYLAVVLDVFSRRIVGWSMATTLRAELVVDALNMALAARQPRGVIHHSDQGSQYTSVAFGKRCREMGVRPSMGSVGDAYDNAMAESFFATLECELLARHRFKTQAQARLAVFESIEGFYNPRRRHSALGYLSPNEFERGHARALASPGLPEPGAVLAAVKDKPWRARHSASLTAAARAALGRLRAGTKERAPQGPNKGTAQPRRTTPRHITYFDPKSSTVRETGAGPACGRNPCEELSTTIVGGARVPGVGVSLRAFSPPAFARTHARENPNVESGRDSRSSLW
jgi:putative transposase